MESARVEMGSVNESCPEVIKILLLPKDDEHHDSDERVKKEQIPWFVPGPLHSAAAFSTSERFVGLHLETLESL